METSLMVDDYPVLNEEKTFSKDFNVYVKLTFRNIELEKGYTPEDFIKDNGILDYEDFEVEEVEDI